MKLKQVKCLSCGSSIDYNPTTDRQKCDSCRSVFLLEKEEAPDNIYIFNQEIPLTEKQETMVELDQLLVHL
jgi:DNA-directed RNA polymerase subunit RPC12/RpoP